MKKAALLLLAVFLGIWALGGCQPSPAGQPQAPVKFVSLASGGTGATYYLVMSGVAKLFNKYVPGVRANSEVTAASAENVRLVGTGKVTLGLVSTDIAYYAYNGMEFFKDQKIDNVRSLMAGHYSYQPYVTLDPNIKSIPELKGKRVSIGAAGSGHEVTQTAFLRAGYGIDPRKDFQIKYLTYVEQVTALRDGSLDVGGIGGGIPTSALVDLFNTSKAYFISIDPEAFKRAQEKYPYMEMRTIPAGTYRGQDKDALVVAVGANLLVRNDLDEPLAYQFTKAILEHTDELAEIHPAGKEYNLKDAMTGIVVPFHPGAIRYYKERGLAVPEKLLPPEAKK